jgi:hypothetical protein
MYCNNIKEVVLLLVLGIGYIVLSLAKKEKGGAFKKLGLVIGTFMVVLAGLLLVVGFLFKVKLLHKGYNCTSLTEHGFIKEQDPPELNLK